MFEGHRDQGRASDAMDSSEFKIGCRDLTNRVNHDEPCTLVPVQAVPPAVAGSRPTWRDRSRTRRLLLYSLVFRLLDLIQLGLHVGQCPKDLPPRFVLIL